MDRPNSKPAYRYRCCGHSDAETVAMTRWRCQQCGQLQRQSELRIGVRGFTHPAGAEHCGPVLQERAQSHAEVVDWLWQAARERA